MNAVWLVVSWLTVLPVRGSRRVDRTAAGRAIALAPLVGVGLGVVAAGLLWVLCWAGMGFVLAALVSVGALAVATRGMHLDGLADVADGLGSYGPPERAREIMKSGGAGPFGVVALIFAIGVQAAAFAALAEQGRWLAIGLAVAAGRVAMVAGCRGYAPAPGSGFGTLVARTQSVWTVAGWSVIALGASVFADHRHWQGPMAIVVGAVGAALLVRHCVRRFGGLNGDVLGAASETAVAVTAALLTLS